MLPQLVLWPDWTDGTRRDRLTKDDDARLARPMLVVRIFRPWLVAVRCGDVWG